MTLTAASQTIPGYYDTVGGKVQTGTKMPMAINPMVYQYWSGGRQWINAVKSSKILANPTALPGGPDANGYYDSSTSGNWTVVTHSPGAGNQWIKTGVWVLRWTGSADCVWNGGVEINPGTANRKTYNVTDPVMLADMTIVISGGTCTNVEILSPGDEANFDAGDILTTEFKQNFAGITCMRLMQMMFGSGNNFFTMGDILTNYDHISWQYDERTVPNLRTCLPPEAACKMGIEMDTDIWINVPYKFDDADITLLAQEFDTHWIGTDKKIYVERGNEYWNGFTVFADQAGWDIHGTEPAVQATVDIGSKVITSVAHGRSTGDRVRQFFNALDDIAVQEWPYAQGANGYVIKLTDDTFQIAATYDDSLNTIPRTDTFKATGYVYKYAGSGAVAEDFNSWDTDYAALSLNVWNLFKAQLGDKQLNVAGTQNRVGGPAADRTEKIMSTAGVREAIDVFCLGPYFRMSDYTPDDQWWQLTNAQMLDYLKTTEADAQSEFVRKHTEATGVYNIVVYEGGNEFGGDAIGEPNATEKQAKNLEFVDSPEMTEFLTFHGSWLATNGYQLNAHFEDAHAYKGTDIISLMEYSEQTTARQYVGYKVHLDSNGAVKL